MSFEYIKSYYGIEFKKGQRVLALGKSGTVSSATNHVYVKLDGARQGMPYHPTDVIHTKGEG
jgi:hypothetical protein